MGVTIAKILALPLFAQSRLLAGEGGVSRVVDGLALLESADSVRWVAKNSLIISNASLLHNDAALCGTVIADLARQGAAGIALKLNRHLSTVPAVMLEAAQALGFPILSLPYGVTSTQVINAVTYEILQSESYDTRLSLAENFIRELLIANVSKHAFLNRAAMLGWDIHKPLGLLAVHTADPADLEGAVSLCREAPFQYGFPLENLAVAVADMESLPDPDQALAEYAGRLSNALPQRCASRCTVGAGRCYRQLALVTKSYYEAKAALYFTLTDRCPQPVSHFGKLGVYTILLEPKNRGQLGQFYDLTAGLLARHDKEAGTEYLRTVTAFLEHGSVERTAKALFVHYNTVRYRLRKIRDLIGVNIEDRDSLLNLEIAIRIGKLRAFL